MANKDLFRGAISSVRKRFFDSFNRASQTGLGVASDGSSWNQVRGSFSIASSQATASSNDYPIATIDLPFSDVNIELSGTSQGSAAALWVTDSGNWWAVGIETQQIQECQTCTQCASYSSNCNAYSTNSSNCNATSYVSSYCNSNYAVASYTVPYNYTCLKSYYFCYTYGGNCNSSNAKYGYCNSRNPYVTNCATNYYYSTCSGTDTVYYYTCTGSYNSAYSYCSGNYNVSNTYCSGTYNSECTSYSTYNCNCVFVYPKYIKLIKSAANVISTVASWAVSSTVNSLRVKTSGDQITAQAFSDASLTNQIGGDIVYTPSGVIVETQFGISISPSYDQGYSIDEVNITEN